MKLNLSITTLLLFLLGGSFATPTSSFSGGGQEGLQESFLSSDTARIRANGGRPETRKLRPVDDDSGLNETEALSLDDEEEYDTTATTESPTEYPTYVPTYSPSASSTTASSPSSTTADEVTTNDFSIGGDDDGDRAAKMKAKTNNRPQTAPEEDEDVENISKENDTPTSSDKGGNMRGKGNGEKPSNNDEFFLGDPKATDRNVDDRPEPIIGGGPAVVGEYPYYVSLARALSICGGTLIAPKVVLSAAHCTFAAGSNTAIETNFVGQQVRVGAYFTDFVPNPAVGTDGSVLATVVEQWTHPLYFVGPTGLLYNDFMLLRLATEVNVDSDIKLTLSDDASDVAPGQQLTIIGLGSTDPIPDEGTAPNELYEVDFTAISDAECAARWAASDPEVHICAGNDVDRSSCRGDSGGPYLYKDGDTHYQVGVVSFGSAVCGELPSVAAEIPGNPQGFDVLKTQVCDVWEEEAHFCDGNGGQECESDCDCESGYTCECIDDDRRQLKDFEQQLSFLFEEYKEDNDYGDEENDEEDDDEEEEEEQDGDKEDYVHSWFSSSSFLRSKQTDLSQPRSGGRQRVLKSDSSSRSSKSDKSCKSGKSSKSLKSCDGTLQCVESR